MSDIEIPQPPEIPFIDLSNVVIPEPEINVPPLIMRSTWSYEDEQDLRAWHNTQAELVLTEMLASEITNEIDREILSDLGMARNLPPLQWHILNRLRCPLSSKVNWKKEGF